MKLVFGFLNQWSGLPKIILHSSLAKAVSNSVTPFNCLAGHPYNWNGLNVWSRPNHITGLPWWLSGKESACQCRRHKFDPWVRKIPWRRKWQPTVVFLPGKSHGQRSLVGYSPWGHKETDTTEHTCARTRALNWHQFLRPKHHCHQTRDFWGWW